MPITVQDVLHPGKTRTMSDNEVTTIIRRCQILGSGLSGRIGVKIRPGKGWAADPVKMVLIYDLGTAAILNDRARTGVIAHEAGHLRITKNYDPDKLIPLVQKYPKKFHTLCNGFEDRRMELLMEKEFPGLKGDFEELARTFDIPEMEEGLRNASAAAQFMQGCYRIIYDRAPITTFPEVYEELQRLAPEFDSFIHLGSTQELADALQVRGGVFETLVRFIEDPPEGDPGEQGEEGDCAEDGDGNAESQSAGEGEDDGEAGDGDSGEGESDGEGDGDGKKGKKGKGKSGKGDDSGDGDDTPRSGKGQTHVDAGGGGDGRGGAVLDAEFVEVPPLDLNDVPEREEADMDSLAGLTDNARAMLDDLLSEMKDTPQTRGVAQQVQERLDGIARQMDQAGSAIEKLRNKQRSVDDDKAHPSAENITRYKNAAKTFAGKASTLSRDLGSVLRENSFDRWSVKGFRKGPKIHTRKLVDAKLGKKEIYRRKERPKNRKYAVSILVDVSGSMMGSRIQMAQDAAILVGMALEKSGIKCAIYAFGSDTVCVKPFDRSMEERSARLGGMMELGFGSHTCMGWGMKRASEELLAQYGSEDWRKLVIVITDGMPNFCHRAGHSTYGDPRVFVKELESKYDTECIGIGIAEDGVASIFPHAHTVIHDVNELPKTLVQTIRSRVKRG